MAETPPTAEHARLAEATGRAEDDLFAANPWYEWGPYLSERAWGTVREDYSASGDAWNSFPHDHARSRAYRWNEDGMAGISDIRHELCLALALWNGRDPILKERMFGLTGPQGNHGEDVKEYWWYLDGLPSHALLKWRYHYPQSAYPYDALVHHGRGMRDPELELLDTGAFADDRYWSVEVTYAKASPTEILARISIENHGPEEATLDVLPTLWFRNTWSWGDGEERPRIVRDGAGLLVEEHRLAGYRLDAASDGAVAQPLFCDNETNARRLFGVEGGPAYPKDGINDHVVVGRRHGRPRGGRDEGRAALPADRACGRPGGGASPAADSQAPPDWAGAGFGGTLAAREADADAFYSHLAPAGTDAETMQILRQACAGLIWSKQMYPYDVRRWLDGDPGQPAPPPGHAAGRNRDWRHLDSFDVLSMPDPWEYPWFAAWDLAFHTVVWAHIDPAFAKYQLVVLLREWFLHPNGALPSYEWSFDDVNPPVHAMAAVRVFRIDGARDREFLERIFQKLLLNFTWWLNRQDPDGNNVFGGGFLGLDNISPLDRSHLPAGYTLEEGDGTAWMAYYALTMLAMAVELSELNPVYDDMVVKFLEQFQLIVRALNEQGLYDVEDGFFYDRLVSDTGGTTAVKVQTIAGMIPLLPAINVPPRTIEHAARLGKRFARARERWAREDRSTVGRVHLREEERSVSISVLGPEQLRLALRSFFDEDAFLSPYGVRSVSKRYEGNPYTVPGSRAQRSTTSRRSRRHRCTAATRTGAAPSGSPSTTSSSARSCSSTASSATSTRSSTRRARAGELTLLDIAQDLSDRLVSIWRRDSDGRRPVYGGVETLQQDPAWRDNLLFFEHFHGDNGSGLGAMHQTGWTALVADLILDPPAPAR